jgi:hypothetical protein
METSSPGDPAQDAAPAKQNAYGLSPARIAEILGNAAALEADVMRLAKELPFEAEPWGFGDGLLRLAESNE